jgi:uncharacterized protein (TIGR02271 family)
VQTGAVKLKKEVVSERQNVEVPGTREEVVIEFENGKEIRVPRNCEWKRKGISRLIPRESENLPKNHGQTTSVASHKAALFFRQTNP